MALKITKGLVAKFYNFYYFNWGFYFSAGSFCYKKIVSQTS
ncbi:hypothetical protein rsdtw13_06780 [Clostridium sp. TW13]|uniref:Uncharacterized protein n=1 Tax=Inconstantimicrobium mannanitabidum TaxID=1604901 RepID=A0ACB5R8R1_9CLOT|nr:hypothetical protein rsdtw13_06780 [Clostridium sp. TW13]